MTPLEPQQFEQLRESLLAFGLASVTG
jgi:hypothetical protein